LDLIIVMEIIVLEMFQEYRYYKILFDRHEHQRKKYS